MNALVPLTPVAGPNYAARLRAHYREVSRRLAEGGTVEAAQAVKPEMSPARRAYADYEEIWSEQVVMFAALVSAAVLLAWREAWRGRMRPVLGASTWVQVRVAADYGVTREELIGPQRKPRFVEPRQVAIWIVFRSTRASLPRVGALFGGRDHTTVLHSVRRVEARRVRDGEFRRRTDRLMRQAETLT